MDSGGNADTQSSTTVIRTLYTEKVHFKNIFAVMSKELKVGIITGTILVAVNFVRMILLGDHGLAISLTVFATLLLTVTLSKIIGGVLPLIADKVNVDPTFMAGSIITTLVDTFALLIYFEVTTHLINL
ncbi:magnesium transporter [Peptoniphilus asaccharolyticus]